MALSLGPGRLSIGVDIVQISRIVESLDEFGDRFAQRLFTEQEIAYARSSQPLMPERFAARFAAKEAAIKALNLAQAGVNWRDIEVLRGADGACSLVFHGRVAQILETAGYDEVALSLSHDGDYATAMVAALRRAADGTQPAGPH